MPQGIKTSYAWQEKGEQLRIPATISQRKNVLGFMNRDNDLFYYSVKGSVTKNEVIRVFEDFAEQMQNSKYGAGDRYTLVVVDNASIHRCKLREKLNNWMIEKKLIVCYLPTDSPELNLIEILWNKIKYEWLNIMKVINFNEFEKELKRVFDLLGKEYMISFV